MKTTSKAALCLLLVFFCFSFFIDAAPISVVWQVNRSACWEEDWINEMLEGVDIKMIDDGRYKKFINNSIVVICAAHNFSSCEDYFKKMQKKKLAFGVILLGDERYQATRGFYRSAKFVFRNYWHKNFAHTNHIHIFPLGYKTGFWKDGYVFPKPASERDFIWSFAGQITKKPTREAMIHHLKKVPNYHIHETFAWADPNSLDVISYRNLLLESIFAPCPTGWWNLDSFRVYEALESGCIPIVEKNPLDYFFKYLGPHPFLAVDSWDQAPDLMKALLEDPILLDQRQQECCEWWQAHKKMKNSEFKNVIQEAFYHR